MRKITKRSAAVIAGAALAVTGGTAAFAFVSGWFQGSGTANATTSTIQTVTATIDLDGGDPTKRLFPGRTINVSGTVSNPNDYRVRILGATITGVSATKNGNPNNACGSANTAGLSMALPEGGLPINGGVVNAPNIALGTLSMAQNASKECAGSRITATVSFTGELE